MPFSSLKPGKLGDLSYLLQESYEENLLSGWRKHFWGQLEVFGRQEQLQKSLSQAILVPDDQLENLDRNKAADSSYRERARNGESAEKRVPTDPFTGFGP